jgi:pimeloyl-ACP methyl ester carboxylesterase
MMRRLGALVSVVATAAGVILAVTAPPATAAETASVEWQKCRTYSDDLLVKEFVNPEDLPALKSHIARRECGTVTVPLDYADPRGRTMKIAITRYRATEPQNRLGAMAVNPGGPGISGVLLPALLGLDGARDLLKRFDMIGFDPRGIGDSSPRLVCEQPQTDEKLTLDKAEARRNSELQATANRECVAKDPALAASLNTTNVARDLDRVRAALGERTLSYFGFSYGTGLGAVYQSLFPRRVGRMALDSVDIPKIDLARMDDDVVAARERNHGRFVAWIADFQERFGLGRTPEVVAAEIRRIRAFFAATPRDVPGIGPVDEIAVAKLSTQISFDWPRAAADLSTLKKVKDGNASAASVTANSRRPAWLEPEFNNNGVFVAVDCNTDVGPRDFEQWFQRWEQRRKRYPVAGITTAPASKCTGWPIPGRPAELADTDSRILLVGHEFEDVTPISWTRDMRARVGGAALVVEDDVHGSVDFGPCAANVVTFLIAGSRTPDRCEGFPLPDPDELQAQSLTRRPSVTRLWPGQAR